MLRRQKAENQGERENAGSLGIGSVTSGTQSVNVMANFEVGEQNLKEVISEQVGGREKGSGEMPMESEEVKESRVEEAYEQWRLPWLGSKENKEKGPMEAAIQTPKVLETMEKTCTGATSSGGKHGADYVFSTGTSKGSTVKISPMLKTRVNIKFAEIKGKGIAFQNNLQQKVVGNELPGEIHLINKKDGNVKAGQERQEYNYDEDSGSSSSESETSEDEISSASDNNEVGWEDRRLGMDRHYPTFPPPPPPLQPPPSPPQSHLPPVLSAPPVSYSHRQYLEPQAASAWPGYSTVKPEAAVPSRTAGVLSAGPVSYWTFSTPPPPLHQPPPSFPTSAGTYPSPSKLSDWQSPSSTLPQVQSKTSPSPLGPMFIQTQPAAPTAPPFQRCSTPAKSSIVLGQMFQLFGTPRSARHDPLSPSPADQRIVQSPPAQVYSAAEYWRRHKEEERKVEEEKLRQEKELIMKEAQRFVEQKRAAEEKKALAMRRWLAGEEKEVAEEEFSKEHELLAREKTLPEEKYLSEEKRVDATRTDEISQRKMLAQAKVMADEMWIAEQKKVAQEKKEAAEAEEKRIAEENYKKLADEKWRHDLARLAELQKLADEIKAKKLADEKGTMERLAEERKQADKLEEETRQAEEKRVAEEKKKTEEKKMADEEKKVAEMEKPKNLMDLSSSAGLAELLRLADEETLVEEKMFAFEEYSLSSEESTEDEEESDDEEESLIVDRGLADADERLLAEDDVAAPGEKVVTGEYGDKLRERGGKCEADEQGWITAVGSCLMTSSAGVKSEGDAEGEMVAGSEKRKAEAGKLEEFERKRLRLEEQFTPVAEEYAPLEESLEEAERLEEVSIPLTEEYAPLEDSLAKAEGLEEQCTTLAEAEKLEELRRKRLRLEERRAEISLKMEALKVAGVY